MSESHPVLRSFLAQDLFLAALTSLSAYHSARRLRHLRHIRKARGNPYVEAQNNLHLTACFFLLLALIDTDGTRNLYPWQLVYVFRAISHVCTCCTILLYVYCSARALLLTMQIEKSEFLAFRPLISLVAGLLFLFCLDIVLTLTGAQENLLRSALAYTSYILTVTCTLVHYLIWKAMQTGRVGVATGQTIPNGMVDIEIDMMIKFTCVFIVLSLLDASYVACQNGWSCVLAGWIIPGQAAPSEYPDYPAFPAYVLMYLLVSNVLMHILPRRASGGGGGSRVADSGVYEQGGESPMVASSVAEEDGIVSSVLGTTGNVVVKIAPVVQRATSTRDSGTLSRELSLNTQEVLRAARGTDARIAHMSRRVSTPKRSVTRPQQASISRGAMHVRGTPLQGSLEGIVVGTTELRTAAAGDPSGSLRTIRESPAASGVIGVSGATAAGVGGGVPPGAPAMGVGMATEGSMSGASVSATVSTATATTNVPSADSMRTANVVAAAAYVHVEVDSEEEEGGAEARTIRPATRLSVERTPQESKNSTPRSRSTRASRSVRTHRSSTRRSGPNTPSRMYLRMFHTEEEEEDGRRGTVVNVTATAATGSIEATTTYATTPGLSDGL